VVEYLPKGVLLPARSLSPSDSRMTPFLCRFAFPGFPSAPLVTGLSRIKFLLFAELFSSSNAVAFRFNTLAHTLLARRLFSFLFLDSPSFFSAGTRKRIRVFVHLPLPGAQLQHRRAPFSRCDAGQRGPSFSEVLTVQPGVPIVGPPFFFLVTTPLLFPRPSRAATFDGAELDLGRNPRGDPWLFYALDVPRPVATNRFFAAKSL